MATIDPMQQEAMRRVQAMQSRMPQRQRQEQKPPPVTKEIPKELEINPEPPPVIEHKTNNENNLQNSLNVLFKDKEQNLILMLILLLAGDGADPSVLLALMYLLI